MSRMVKMAKVDTLVLTSKTLGEILLDVRYYKKIDGFGVTFPPEISLDMVTADTRKAVEEKARRILGEYDEANLQPYEKVIHVVFPKKDKYSWWLKEIREFDNNIANVSISVCVLERRKTLDRFKRQQYQCRQYHDGIGRYIGPFYASMDDGIIFPYSEELETTICYIVDEINRFSSMLCELFINENAVSSILKIGNIAALSITNEQIHNSKSLIELTEQDDKEVSDVQQ